jgi:hypothetical protein
MPSSLLMLLDDIATVLDDVAVLTKVAAKKTAGVLGDDLALNAQQVTGLRAERELPVVWGVAKGSLVNKAILVPAALAISALVPWAVTPLLMLGGAYLCFEGAEKLVHKLVHRKEDRAAHHAELISAVADPEADLVAIEKQKIKGAIRTDFVLSAEIVTITLGTVATASFVTRVSVLSSVALLMTVGVYGVVAGIVKLDDLGLWLKTRSMSGDAKRASFESRLGGLILLAAPWLMKALAVAGTTAMFLVGGGILAHGIPKLHDAVHGWAGSSPFLGFVLPLLADLLVGIVAGAVVVAIWSGIRRFRSEPGT